jgi:mono/diheme cytochrome c family protein
VLLDNQVAKLEPHTDEQSKPSMVISFVAVLLVMSLAVLLVSQFHVSDPYTKTVLSLNGDSVQGHAIFQMNCAGCHGLKGDGKVGPSLHHVSGRKSRSQIIHQVISGETPPMPQFKPNTQEMADLLSYLEKL